MAEKGTTITAEHSKKLRDDVLAMAETQTKVTLKLAELLHEVYYATIRQNTGEVPLVVAWGHDSFDEWAEHELGMHQTTARGLVSLYDELVAKRALDPELLARIKITKLRQLAKASKQSKDERSFKSWVSKAVEMSCCEFEHAIDEAFGGAEKKWKPFTYSIPLGQYTSFLKTLRQMKERYGVSSNGEALVRALKEVSSAPDGVRRKTG